MADAAVAGLLGVTALNLSRHAFTHWAYPLVALAALLLALRTQVHPLLLLLGGTVLGSLIGVVAGAGTL